MSHVYIYVSESGMIYCFTKNEAEKLASEFGFPRESFTLVNNREDYERCLKSRMERERQRNEELKRAISSGDEKKIKELKEMPPGFSIFSRRFSKEMKKPEYVHPCVPKNTLSVIGYILNKTLRSNEIILKKLGESKGSDMDISSDDEESDDEESDEKDLSSDEDSEINVLSPYAEDFQILLDRKVINSRIYGPIYTRHSRPGVDRKEIINYISNAIQKNADNVRVALKVGRTFKDEKGNYSGHIFSIYVDISPGTGSIPNRLSNVIVVDTTPVRIDPTILINTIKAYLGPLNLDTRYTYYEFPLNDLLSEYKDRATGLQRVEGMLKIQGYCAAWVLYFIDQVFNNDREISDVYRELLDMSPVENTAMIIHWWDDMLRKAR